MELCGCAISDAESHSDTVLYLQHVQVGPAGVWTSFCRHYGLIHVQGPDGKGN